MSPLFLASFSAWISFLHFFWTDSEKSSLTKMLCPWGILLYKYSKSILISEKLNHFWPWVLSFAEWFPITVDALEFFVLVVQFQIFLWWFYLRLCPLLPVSLCNSFKDQIATVRLNFQVINFAIYCVQAWVDCFDIIVQLFTLSWQDVRKWY